MLADLHIHTIHSDGKCTVGQIIDILIENKIKIFSITDHDTTEGVKHTANLIQNNNKIKLITGIEISAEHRTNLHLLGYRIDISDEGMKKTIEKIQNKRKIEYEEILHKLNKLNMNIDENDVIKHRGGLHIHSIAETLTEMGYVKTKKDAINDLLRIDKPAYVKKYKIGIDEAVDCIHNAGGYVVLAHPIQSFPYKNGFEKFICNLKKRGIDGIEVYSPYHDNEFISLCMNVANKYDLFISGGSDFHGDMTKGNLLGKTSHGYISAACLSNDLLK